MFAYTVFLITVASVLFTSVLSQTQKQKQIDDVVVTGDLTEILLCKENGSAHIYNVTIKLHAKNIGTHAIIISGADALPQYYKFANSLENLSAKQYEHINWDGPGPEPDPKVVPLTPVKPFRVVLPGKSIDINFDFRLFESSELKPGDAYLQIIAENWPGYSDAYTLKLRRAWSATGNLWAHSLRTEPIAFVLPNLKQVHCP